MKKKTIIDYLKTQEDKRESFIDVKWDEKDKEFVYTEISLVLVEYGIHIYVSGDLKEIVGIHADCENEIMFYLYDTYGIEVRFCDYCGCPMQSGHTDDDEDFYNCEECFPKDMDERYGKGNWRACEDGKCNEVGGFYEYFKDGEWVPEPSYYTEW